MRVQKAVCGAVIVALAISASAASSVARTPLRDTVRSQLASVERAEAAARGGDPDLVQAHYDAARDFAEDLRLARPAASCVELRSKAMLFAQAHVTQAEGFDKQRSDVVSRAKRDAATLKRHVDAELGRCGDAGKVADGEWSPLREPSSGQAATGSVRVRADAPARVTAAFVAVDRQRVGCTDAGGARKLDVRGRTFAADLRLATGRHDVTVSYCSGTAESRLVATRSASNVWVLPDTAALAVDARSPDRVLSGKLKSTAASFTGYSAVWFHDLRTGRTAEWNSGARFPAASTVKVGLLVAALRVLGGRPDQSRFAYDLDAMLRWSSNLAANRLLQRVGNGSSYAGARVADRVLKQLGAASSTYTGEYRVGTGVGQINAQPPLVSSRVTTARDLGRLLFQVHAGAIGRKTALGKLRLDQRRAQLALGLLLSSESLGDNTGLIRGSVPRSVPMAQKHGWLRDARHSAAIVYGRRGPQLVVVLTYRPGVTLGAGSAYAGDVLRILRVPGGS